MEGSATVAASPLPELERWSAMLEQLSHQPLSLCPHSPGIARRWEAWWHQQCVDRPVFVASVLRAGTPSIGRGMELLNEPARWLAASRPTDRHWLVIGRAPKRA